MTTVDPAPAPTASSSSLWQAPSWAKTFYAKFPLVVLPQDDPIPWEAQSSSSYSLWIHPPPTTPHVHYRPWASSSPASLRAQLLLLLRAPTVDVSFRSWYNEAAAPKGTLPALHLPAEGRLLSTDEIRGWVDQKYPMKGKQKELQGMPSQEAYDQALAVAQLVLGPLHRAYLASLPSRPDSWHLSFPTPPPLLAGLTTPLPAAFTGDTREVDTEEVISKGVGALEALAVLLSEKGWALGAAEPTPLDALIVGYLYPIYSLESTQRLSQSVQQHEELGDYVDRVLERAGRNVR